MNSPPAKCNPGHYCKEGTPDGDYYPCPPGKWTNKTNLAMEDECWDCPRGYYCEEGSKTQGKVCPAGYYCPLGLKMCNFLIFVKIFFNLIMPFY